MTSLDVTCPKCGGAAFELRLLKDEGVGAANCSSCGRNYLLLDSGDYWFDVIQQGYPRPIHCSCKGTSFALRFEYEYRPDGDVRSVAVSTACASCGKTRRQMRIEIDYSPTRNLVRRPLTYCRNPKILYDLQELTLYASKADIARITRYLVEEGACRLTGILRENDRWVVRHLDAVGAEAAIRGDRYLRIYAAPGAVEVPQPEAASAKSEDRFWKRQEVIRISAPTSMSWGLKTGLLYYINFANEFVERGRVQAKSPGFRRTTAALVEWLKTQFVAWRGASCFDNPREHTRLFGKRFRRAGDAVGE